MSVAVVHDVQTEVAGPPEIEVECPCCDEYARLLAADELEAILG